MITGWGSIRGCLQKGPWRMVHPRDLANPRASSARYCSRMGPLLVGEKRTWEKRLGGGWHTWQSVCWTTLQRFDWESFGFTIIKFDIVVPESGVHSWKLRKKHSIISKGWHQPSPLSVSCWVTFVERLLGLVLWSLDLWESLLWICSWSFILITLELFPLEIGPLGTGNSEICF